MNTIDHAYSQFCRKRFPLPSLASIANMEPEIGVVFPDDYRKFLLEYNGGWFTEPDIVAPPGAPEDALTFMHGIGASHPRAELARPHELAIWDDNDPPQIVPIGYTLMGYFVML